jgi:hypothetical protein
MIWIIPALVLLIIVVAGIQFYRNSKKIDDDFKNNFEKKQQEIF